jgi:AbrB family looped-hinge helix DNA binding protein
MESKDEIPKGIEIARLTSKGQVTIPKRVREALDLQDGDAVLFEYKDGCAVIAKIPNFLDLAGSMKPPPELRGKSWSEIRETASRKQTERYVGRGRRH